MTKIIAFIGVIGSGKNFRSEKILREEKNSILVGFSDGVRDYTWKLLKWEPSSSVEYEKFKEKTFNFSMPDFSNLEIRGRDFLQRIGTDIMRHYDNDVWANTWLRTVEREILSGIDIIVVPDLRYPNELKVIKRLKDKGNIVEIIFTNYRSFRYKVDLHESEKMARELIEEGFADGEDVTNFLIEKYGN